MEATRKESFFLLQPPKGVLASAFPSDESLHGTGLQFRPACGGWALHPFGRNRMRFLLSGFACFGWFAVCLVFHNLSVPSNSSKTFLLSAFPISAFVSILVSAFFLSSLLTTCCDLAKCRIFHCFFSGQIFLEKINPESFRGSGLQTESCCWGERQGLRLG